MLKQNLSEKSDQTLNKIQDLIYERSNEGR